MSSDSLAPQQQRSRETLARLLKATIEMLEAHGLDGATIPRIAAAAGVAPATVYRRFRDRDALYRAAFLDALEQSAAAHKQSMRIESFKDRTLEGVVSALVTAVIKQYHMYPGVLKALNRFVDRDTDEAFKAKGVAIVSGNFKAVVEVLLTCRAEIVHPNARRAITFGLLGVVTSVEARALEEVSMWHHLLPISDRELQKELTRSFLAYLRSK